MKRKLFTPGLLEQRPPASGRVEVRDSLSPLILQISSHGNRIFCVRARVKGQRNPLRIAFGAPAHISVLEEARTWAVATVGQLRRGEDPRPQKEAIAAAQKSELERSERTQFLNVVSNFRETKRIFEMYVLPRWQHLQIEHIKRADVVSLLDDLESRRFLGQDGQYYGGPVQADRVLAHVRKLMNWHATRDDQYMSPIVKGMARTRPKERARTRVLSDDEIKLIWNQLEKLGTYGAAIKMLFLTAQRVGEVSQMGRSQIDTNYIWEIPATLYKTKRPQFVPLSETAVRLVQAQVQVDGSDLVFPAERDPKKPMRNLSTLKADIDGLVTEANGNEPLPRWTLHDIRRTCRTLMSRGGIPPHIAERVLGHVIPGVEGVYDRHSYLDEKRHALEILASRLTQITNPPPQLSVVAAE